MQVIAALQGVLCPTPHHLDLRILRIELRRPIDLLQRLFVVLSVGMLLRYLEMGVDLLASLGLSCEFLPLLSWLSRELIRCASSANISSSPCIRTAPVKAALA